jgi:hypothetical protein
MKAKSHFLREACRMSSIWDYGLRFAQVLGVLIVCSISCSTAAEVEARLDREYVVAGNGALMTLKISGSSTGKPEIPEIENLIIQPRGQNQQMQILEGRTIVSVTFSYVVGSNTPDDYQIPAMNVTVDGEKYSTQPLKLKVLDSTAQSPKGLVPNSPSQQQELDKRNADEASALRKSQQDARVDADFKKINEALNDSYIEQVASGFMADFHGTAVTFYNLTGNRSNALKETRNQNIQISLNTLSHQLKGKKVELFETNAALFGQAAFRISIFVCIVIFALITYKIYKVHKSKLM